MGDGRVTLTRPDLEREAAATGFAAETLEKVIRLLGRAPLHTPRGSRRRPAPSLFALLTRMQLDGLLRS